MNIIERARLFAQSLRQLMRRFPWEWGQCPHCGSSDTIKHGSYQRRPWTFAGRQVIRVQRHLCRGCGKTYSETAPWLVRYSWYGREVHRCAVDQWLHLRSSLRRTAELLRSWLGRQERWVLWRSWEEEEGADPRLGRERCYLSASTLHRWLDRAGQCAAQHVPDQWAGVASSGQFGTDGLWARLRHGSKRVILTLVDTVTGVVGIGYDARRWWWWLGRRVRTVGQRFSRGRAKRGCRWRPSPPW